MRKEAEVEKERSYGRWKRTRRTLLIWEGMSLVAEDSILVFEPPKGATRTRILNPDSTQSLQSSIWLIHGNHIQTIYCNHPSFSNRPSLTPSNA